MLSVLRTRSPLPSCVRHYHSEKIVVGNGEPIVLTTGHIARFASGSVVASQGDNAVLATCVFNKSPSNDFGFVPLTVDFRQSAAAIGKIPTNYLRREMSQSDSEIIASRIIDRTIRPLFPKQWENETQIVCKPLSLDEQGDGVLLAVNAASAAVHLSEVPFNGPVAAVRLALLDGKIYVNPDGDVRRNSEIDMVLSGCGDRRTVMIEMDGKQVPIQTMERLFDEGLDAVATTLESMSLLHNKAGKQKMKLESNCQYMECFARIEKLAEERLYYILTDIQHDKISRDNAIKDVASDIKELADVPLKMFGSIFGDVVKMKLRKLALEDNLRPDGRRNTDFRHITINVDVYKKLHGSALFQRGQTQVMSTVTFDSPAAAFHPDSIAQMLGAQRKKMFMLHYEFPSFATNDINNRRGVNRREIGHGALAEKSLKHVIPSDFPYSIRLACQVLESNGSSSMASVCSGSLAMYDAGVPIKAPAAGVAMGLISDENNNYTVLTDIMGMEDYAGDMDFKIAGTSNGFTAVQLDVKIPGLTREQLSESLAGGKDGIDHVLSKMAVMRDRPREEFKATVPVLEEMSLDGYRRQTLFRNGGYNAKLIESETGVKISSEDDSHISFFAPNKVRLEEAKKMLLKLVNESDSPELAFGSMVAAEVSEMFEKGVNVSVQGFSRPIFMANSQLHNTPIKHSSSTGLKVGQKITVQWLGKDSATGQIRLSRRAVTSTSLPTKLPFKR